MTDHNHPEPLVLDTIGFVPVPVTPHVQSVIDKWAEDHYADLVERLGPDAEYLIIQRPTYHRLLLKSEVS